MPDKWPLADGNWSNAANWNGGTKPVAGDDVYADNRTLNVDESFTVATLRSTQRSGGTALGTFNFNTGGISGNITAVSPIINSGNAVNTTITAASGTITLIFSPDAVIVPGGSLMTYSGNCNLIIQGNPTIRGGVASNGGITLQKTSSGTLIITGSLTGAVGGSSLSRALQLAANSGTTIISGSVAGGLVGSGAALRGIELFGGVNLTIIGNVIAGNTTTAHAIDATSSTGTITITGSITGTQASAGTGNAILCSSAATINVLGDITAGFIPAISLSGASTLTVRGSAAATINNPAVISSNASATNTFTGPFINAYDTMAVQCVDMVLAQDVSSSWNFGGITLYSPESLAFYPSSSDIRQGITYSDSTLSGSLIIPSPTNVIAGTPTDNTTGSAVLTPSQLQDNIWGRDLAQMTATGSIGERLSRSATTDSTGKQISSYLV